MESKFVSLSAGDAIIRHSLHCERKRNPDTGEYEYEGFNEEEMTALHRGYVDLILLYIVNPTDDKTFLRLSIRPETIKVLAKEISVIESLTVIADLCD